MKHGLLYTLGLIVLIMIAFATSPAEAKGIIQQQQQQMGTPGPSQPQQSLPSKLIPPRPFTVNQETMDQLARTPPKLPTALTAQEQQAIRDIARLIKAHDTTAATNRWSTLITTLNQKNHQIDITDVLLFVLYETVRDAQEDKKYYVEKVKFYDDQQEQVRREIEKLRQQLQNLPSGRPPHPPGTVNPANITNAIRQWEEKLSSLSNDRQLIVVKLEKHVQQFQLTLPMLSNVSKMMHDTAMAVIRKIGG